MTIKLQFTGFQIIHNEYCKPYRLLSDIDLPRMYNQGYNSFRFIGGEPEFICDEIPCELKMETSNWAWYESQIQVFRKDGSSVMGYYYKTLNKNTNEIREVFSFD